MRRNRNEAITAALRADRTRGSSPISIKGVAQTLVKPTYLKLLSAERFLRKGVPLLTVAFIGTIIVSTIVQSVDYYRQAISDAHKTTFDVTERLGAMMAVDKTNPNFYKQLDAKIFWAAGNNLRKVNIILADKDGKVVAMEPLIPGAIGRSLASVIAEAKVAARAELSWFETFYNGNQEILETSFFFENVNLQSYIFETRFAALEKWRSNTALTVALSVTTSFVVLILGFAFTWQANRAREADVIYDIARSHIDSALTLGRCGLWNWNLSTGQLFWSDSMFEILGMKSDDNLLNSKEVRALIHPGDIELQDLYSSKSVDRIFRMRHATRGWIWLRLRYEFVKEQDGTEYLIGAAAELSNSSELNSLKSYSVDSDHLLLTQKPIISRHKISSRAEDLVQQHTNSDGAVELVGLANSLGLKVYEADFENGLLSSFSKKYEKENEVRCDIFLNDSLPIVMRRWVLAKELAHLLSGSDRDLATEDDINGFAMALVLPSEQFKFAWERIHDEEALGKWFQVPSEIVRARVNELNLRQTVQ